VKTPSISEHRPESKVAQEVRAAGRHGGGRFAYRAQDHEQAPQRGIDVLVAKDGIDAVEQLRDHVPDDARRYRNAAHGRVRADDTRAFRRKPDDIPIIMITSRAGAKHRQKAFDLA
jgi:chemosensory pili system protein ChpA (sensor histidine kinase/response regulator)